MTLINFNPNLPLDDHLDIYRDMSSNAPSSFSSLEETATNENCASLLHAIFRERAEYGEELLKMIASDLESPSSHYSERELYDISEQIQDTIANDFQEQIKWEKKFPRLRPPIRGNQFNF